MTNATYDHTISGLLSKRRDMLAEAERIRDRLAEIKNDLSGLDRTPGTLVFKGDLEAKTRNIVVHIPPHGYWLANEPLPDNVEWPEPSTQKRLHMDRTDKSRRRGRRARLTPEMIEKAKAMLAEGATVKEVAEKMGGIFPSILYYHLNKDKKK